MYVVVCGDVLRNESIKPSHLELHLTTEHAVLRELFDYIFFLNFYYLFFHFSNYYYSLENVFY